MANTYRVRYKKTLPQKIQYPGSTIQQNFAEDLEKGYLLWDIKGPRNFDSNFHRVHNDYGYFTLRAADGKLPDVELPPKCRIRVIWPIAERDISRSLVNELSQMVHDKYKPLSVRIDFKPTRDSRGCDMDVDTMLDVREFNVQQDLLSKWLTSHDIPTEMAAEILDIDKNISEQTNKLEFEDFSQSIWKINNITIKNFMSYKGPEIIDFRKLKGIIGLFGDNRSGKSVLIDAILYALFNKTTRSVKNHDLINKVTGSKKCSVELSITIRGVEYQIIRTTRMQFAKRSGEYTWTRTDLDLSRIHEDGSIEDLTETQRNETEKIIRNAIGSYEDFLTTTLTTQASQTEFIYQNASVRAENMARFLGLDIFNQKHELAKDLLRECDASRKIEDIDKKTTLLKATRKVASQNKTTLKEKKKYHREIGRELKKRRELLETLRDSLNTKINIDQTREEVEQRIVILKKEIDDIVNIINLLIEKTLTTRSRGLLIEQSFAVENATTRKLAEKLNELITAKHQVESFIHTETQLAKSLRAELETDTKCPVDALTFPTAQAATSGCLFLTRASEKRSELETRMNAIESYTVKLNAVEQMIARATDAAVILSENETKRSEVQKITSEMSAIKADINIHKGKIDVKNMAITMLNDKLAVIDKNEEIVQANRALQIQLTETKQQIDKLQDNRDRLNIELTTTSNALAVANARIEELELIITDISTNDHKYELYNWYTKAMHRNGIPITVLKKYIPIINYELNGILSPIVSFGVYFKIEQDSDNIDIVMRYDDTKDDTRPITMASGMEKFISNMAIRHVLLKISCLTKPTLRIIDEGFDVLDNDNIYLVQKFFDNVKTDFDNIVIITHIDALKDCADHVVTVSQQSGVSKLRLN